MPKELVDKNIQTNPSFILYDPVVQRFWYGGEAIELINDISDSQKELTLYALSNWKTFLGDPKTHIKVESAKNNPIYSIFNYIDIDDLTSNYLRNILQSISEFFSGLSDTDIDIYSLPCIIGFPALDDYNWINRYRENLRRIIRSLGFTNIEFLPEPFAVFQYHRYIGNIHDINRQQNVFVIDVGGGTTSTCVIRTKMHGGLSRGGANRLPLGVHSITMGGSTLDNLIIDYLKSSNVSIDQYLHRESLLLKIKEAKEALCNIITDWSFESDTTFSYPIDISIDEDISLNNHELLGIYKHRIWPSTMELINKSILDSQKSIKTDINEFDVVIMAGGGANIGYLEQLMKTNFQKYFINSTFVVCDDYQVAVAKGLMVEIKENKKLYDSRAKKRVSHRIAPYITDNVYLEYSHDGDKYITFVKPENDTKSLVNSESNCIIAAPQAITSLYSKNLRWTIKLKQKPDHIFYNIYKSLEENKDLLNVTNNRINIKNRDKSNISKLVTFGIEVDENGIGNTFFEINLTDKNSRRYSEKYNGDIIDFHSLRNIDMEGDLYLGIDFGTSKTAVSLCSISQNYEEDIITIDNYYINDEAIKRSSELQKLIIKKDIKIIDIIEYCMKNHVFVDYIYDSNRIEGINLDRGNTEKAITSHNYSESTIDIDFTTAGVIFEDGELKANVKIVKDVTAAQNLKKAYDYIVECVQDDSHIFSEVFIRDVHSILMNGMNDNLPGQYRDCQVRLSNSSHIPPDPFLVKSEMASMLDYFREGIKNIDNPIETAVKFHTKFVDIHPFKDGNGRVARLLVNYILLRNRIPIMHLEYEDRNRYYDSLEDSNDGDLSELTILFCDAIESSFRSFIQELKSKKTPLDTSETDQFENEQEIEQISEVEEESPFGILLKKLDYPTKIYVNEEEQYDKWKFYFEKFKLDFRQKIDKLKPIIKKRHDGFISIKSYEIIEFEKYLTIKDRRKFSKTWYFNLLISVNDNSDSTIFYFRYFNDRRHDEYYNTVSLGLSQYAGGNYIPHNKIGNMRIKEILHNGNDPSVMINEAGNFNIEQLDNESIISILLEDIFKNIFFLIK